MKNENAQNGFKLYDLKIILPKLRATLPRIFIWWILGEGKEEGGIIPAEWDLW